MQLLLSQTFTTSLNITENTELEIDQALWTYVIYNTSLDSGYKFVNIVSDYDFEDPKA